MIAGGYETLVRLFGQSGLGMSKEHHGLDSEKGNVQLERVPALLGL
jgi:hypothetical protein